MPGDHSVDFLKEKYDLAPKRTDAKKISRFARFLMGGAVIAAIAGVVFSYKIASTAIDNSGDIGGFSLFSTFRQLVTSDDKPLVGEDDDRINFLLLGNGGAGHDGPELTDTIIFGSFRPSTSEIGMLSIPRDTIVPIPDYGYRKINHVNALAEIEEPGSGPEAAAAVIGGLLDQEIHYTVKVDFQGFVDLINAIGGVDVYVDRSFTDYSYPTYDDLYQTVSFQEGWQHMDGETALQYSRSRHGNNGEGSDFARAARQQKLLLAVKDKVLSPSTLLNPGKLNKILQTFQNNVQTNLTFWEMTKLARYAPDISTENIHLAVLDGGPDSPLYSSNINGAYVLLPKEDDWSEVAGIAEDIFSQEAAESVSAPLAVNETDSTARIEIQNGTGVSGLAFQTSQLLTSSGFDVIKIGNAESRSYDTTIIYDLTQGKKTDELAVLKEFLEADVSMTAEGWAYSDEVVPRELTVSGPEDEAQGDGTIDFLIILGQNASELVMR